ARQWPAGSRDRAPWPAAAPQQLRGGIGTGGTRRVEFKRDGLIRAPHIENRLNHRPTALDTIGTLEQCRVADHAVIDQGLVAGARLGVEVVAIAKIHPYAAEMDHRAGLLGAELQRNSLIRLDL